CSGPEVQEIYDRAGTLCVEFNETEQLARVLYGQIQFHTVRLQLESVQEAADRIEHLAWTGHDSTIAVYGITGSGLARYYRGEFAVAMDYVGGGAVVSGSELRERMWRPAGDDPRARAQLRMAGGLG